ncbi:hypothetical protein Hanom_Chr01g00080681 [Helianthus anomalus]
MGREKTRSSKAISTPNSSDEVSTFSTPGLVMPTIKPCSSLSPGTNRITLSSSWHARLKA